MRTLASLILMTLTLMPGAVGAQAPSTVNPAHAVFDQMMEELMTNGDLPAPRITELSQELTAIMAPRFGLSPAQAARVEPIIRENIAGFTAIWRRHPGPKNILTLRRIKVENEALGRATVRRMSRVLSPEQMRLYMQLRDERQARVRAKMMSMAN